MNFWARTELKESTNNNEWAKSFILLFIKLFGFNLIVANCRTSAVPEFYIVYPTTLSHPGNYPVSKTIDEDMYKSSIMKVYLGYS